MTTKKRSQIGGAPPPGQQKNRAPVHSHPQKEQIDFELAANKSVREIARKFNVHESALYKYRKKMPAQLRAARLGQLLRPEADLEQLRIQESESLLEGLVRQRVILVAAQDKAFDDGNLQLVSTLATGIHRNYEIIGKYLGELQQHSTRTVVSVLVDPRYLRVRNVLLRALEPFPDARRAAAAALHDMENDEARSMSPPMLDVSPPASQPTS